MQEDNDGKDGTGSATRELSRKEIRAPQECARAVAHAPDRHRRHLPQVSTHHRWPRQRLPLYSGRQPSHSCPVGDRLEDAVADHVEGVGDAVGHRDEAARAGGRAEVSSCAGKEKEKMGGGNTWAGLLACGVVSPPSPQPVQQRPLPERAGGPHSLGNYHGRGSRVGGRGVRRELTACNRWHGPAAGLTPPAARPTPPPTAPAAAPPPPPRRRRGPAGPPGACAPGAHPACRP